MGYAFTSKKGNRVTMQENGLLNVTPKNGSTLSYSVDDLVSISEYLREHGFFQHVDREVDREEI